MIRLAPTASALGKSTFGDNNGLSHAQAKALLKQSFSRAGHGGASMIQVMPAPGAVRAGELNQFDSVGIITGLAVPNEAQTRNLAHQRAGRHCAVKTQ